MLLWFSTPIIVSVRFSTGSLSVTGVIYGVLASLFVSLFAIYTKKVSSQSVVAMEVSRHSVYRRLNRTSALLWMLMSAKKVKPFWG